MYYNHNRYYEFFLFTRPDAVANGEKAVKDYEQCKSYILQND
jgi:hypothetical protein